MARAARVLDGGVVPDGALLGDPAPAEPSAERPRPAAPAAQSPSVAPRRAVNVRLGGKEYRVVTDADEGWLQEVASRVNQAMKLVRERTETVDSLDVAMLTALNLARELVALREQVGPLRGPGVTAVDADRLSALIDLAESAAAPNSESISS